MRLLLPILAAGLSLSALPAMATTGPGCLRVVNVPPGDTLNLRAGASARSAIVDRLQPHAHGIIRLEAACTPQSVPWGQRWCPVTHTDAEGTKAGYVKARYIRDQDCP